MLMTILGLSIEYLCIYLLREELKFNYALYADNFTEILLRL